MKTVHAIHTHPHGWFGHDHNLSDWLFEQYDKLVAILNRWAANREAIRELERMPDYLLQDMGVEPSKIAELVRGKTHRG